MFATNYNSYEMQYANMIRQILSHGHERETRNQTTLSTFGLMLTIDELQQHLFPLLNGRRIFYRGVFGELAAMLSGPKHVNDFKKYNCNYWDQWADEDGSINVDYGNAWLDWEGYNQLDQVMADLVFNPYGRRHVISGWRPDRLKDLSLPCCHMLYQFYVDGHDRLCMMWYQRSADVMVGVPSDVVFAAAWLLNMCQHTALQPGQIKMIFTDAHIYLPHLQNAHTYLKRLEDKPELYAERPSYSLTESSLDSRDEYFLPSDIAIKDYQPHSEPLKFKVFS